MKRRDLIRHLDEHGCQFLREGGNHTVYINPTARQISTVPRHGSCAGQTNSRRGCLTVKGCRKT